MFCSSLGIMLRLCSVVTTTLTSKVNRCYYDGYLPFKHLLNENLRHTKSKASAVPFRRLCRLVLFLIGDRRRSLFHYIHDLFFHLFLQAVGALHLLMVHILLWIVPLVQGDPYTLPRSEY